MNLFTVCATVTACRVVDAILVHIVAGMSRRGGIAALIARAIAHVEWLRGSQRIGVTASVGLPAGGRRALPPRDALGIESDDVVNYCSPKEWPTDRERRARIIGEWLNAA